MLKIIQHVNNKFALFLTKIVGTMWCAYIFAMLALVSLPEAIHGGIATLISWIAQTFLQLVLLSVIMVGQDVQSQKTEARDIQDHEAIMAEFKMIKDMQEEIRLIHHEKAGCGYTTFS